VIPVFPPELFGIVFFHVAGHLLFPSFSIPDMCFLLN